MSIDSNEKKTVQLGMLNGTAMAKLRKLILFDLLRRHQENICFRCGGIIGKVEELSIEHKVPWLDANVELFWDLDNIAFSHLRCNIGDARQVNFKGPVPHGTHSGYSYRGCRCQACTDSQATYQHGWKEKHASSLRPLLPTKIERIRNKRINDIEEKIQRILGKIIEEQKVAESRYPRLKPWHS